MIYLILDPRSPYFEIEDNIVSIINSVVRDFPQLERYLDDEIYKILFEFIKKFQDTSLRKEIKNLKEEILNWKGIYETSIAEITVIRDKDTSIIERETQGTRGLPLFGLHSSLP